jgi:putative ABC transport system permease protein
VRFLPLIWKNLRRNPRRTAITLLSVAASLGLLTLLLTVEDGMLAVEEQAGRSPRVSVRHKSSFSILLPIAYQAKLESVPGVEVVNPFSWYGGTFGTERTIMPSISCVADTLQKVWGDRLEAEPQEWERFGKDRMGALVGPLLASRHGWKAGDTITLTGNVIPIDMTFHICGVLSKSFDPQIFFMHREYLEEVQGNPGLVGNYWLRVDRVENVPRVIAAITQMFANSRDPVVAETEKGLMDVFLGLMTMFRLVILAVGSAVVASVMLVTANTIAMSVRERMAEVGVLRAIGFRRRHILGFLLGETCLIAVLGGLAGSTLAWAACRLGAPYMPAGPISVLLAQARPQLIGYGILISMAVGLAGGIIPALGALRVPVSRALRQVA